MAEGVLAQDGRKVTKKPGRWEVRPRPPHRLGPERMGLGLRHL